MSIANQCMIVSISIGKWSGYRLDKEMSARVVEEAQAASDAARVNKHLVPKEALKKIVAAEHAIRNHLYANSLPWKENGGRIMPRRVYETFIKRHSELEGQFETEVEEFLAAYPAIKARAAFRMGALFNFQDYPEPSTLRRRFYCRLDIDPVTEAGDWRVQLTDRDAEERVKSQLEGQMQARVNRAMADVWERLDETLRVFADRMKDPDARFRGALIENLKALARAIPDLNILNDPDLNQLADAIDERLGDLDPKDLRQDSALRKQAAKDAQEIIDSMSGFMNAFKVSA